MFLHSFLVFTNDRYVVIFQLLLKNISHSLCFKTTTKVSYQFFVQIVKLSLFCFDVASNTSRSSVFWLQWWQDAHTLQRNANIDKNLSQRRRRILLKKKKYKKKCMWLVMKREFDGWANSGLPLTRPLKPFQLRSYLPLELTKRAEVLRLLRMHTHRSFSFMCTLILCKVSL